MTDDSELVEVTYAVTYKDLPDGRKKLTVQTLEPEGNLEIGYYSLDSPQSTETPTDPKDPKELNDLKKSDKNETGSQVQEEHSKIERIPKNPDRNDIDPRAREEHSNIEKILTPFAKAKIEAENAKRISEGKLALRNTPYAPGTIASPVFNVTVLVPKNSIAI